MRRVGLCVCVQTTWTWPLVPVWPDILTITVELGVAPKCWTHPSKSTQVRWKSHKVVFLLRLPPNHTHTHTSAHIYKTCHHRIREPHHVNSRRGRQRSAFATGNVSSRDQDNVLCQDGRRQFFGALLLKFVSLIHSVLSAHNAGFDVSNHIAPVWGRQRTKKRINWNALLLKL